MTAWPDEHQLATFFTTYKHTFQTNVNANEYIAYEMYPFHKNHNMIIFKKTKFANLKLFCNVNIQFAPVVLGIEGACRHIVPSPHFQNLQNY